MKRILQLIVPIAMVTLGLATLAPATIIVQWGELGGASDIVGANEWGTTAMTDTYTPGQAINPTVGPSYYPNNTNRSPIFNGAHNGGTGSRYGGNPDTLFWNGTDRFAAGSNTGTTAPNNAFINEAMFMWESSSFVNSPTTQPWTWSLQGRNRSGTDLGGELRIVLEDASGFHISQAFTIDAGLGEQTFGGQVGGLTWFSYTPFNAGVDVIGAASSPDIYNFDAIGFYATAQNTAGNWAEWQTQYFQIAFLPEPSTVALLGMGGWILAWSRRRSKQTA